MQTEKIEPENRMGTQPVNGLLLRVALPLMISMLVQALYNVVDSLYVSQLNQAAFNAVSLSYPIQNIMTAIAFAIGEVQDFVTEEKEKRFLRDNPPVVISQNENPEENIFESENVKIENA